MNSIIRRASAAILPLNTRRSCDVVRSECRLSRSELFPLPKHVPPGSPVLFPSGVPVPFQTLPGILAGKKYGDESVVGLVTDTWHPDIMMEFHVGKGSRYMVFGTFVLPDPIFIEWFTLRSPMAWGILPEDTEPVFLEGFDRFLEERGINCSTVNFLFDKFEKGFKRFRVYKPDPLA